MKGLNSIGVVLIVGFLLISIASAAQPAIAQWTVSAKPTGMPALRIQTPITGNFVQKIISVEIVSPTQGQHFSQDEVVSISAEVKGKFPVTSVVADITLPDFSVEHLQLTKNGNDYQVDFTSTSLSGDYIILVTAKNAFDTATDTANFHVDDITLPVVEFVSPTPENGFLTSNPDVTIKVQIIEENPNQASLYIDSEFHSYVIHTEEFVTFDPTFEEGPHTYYVKEKDKYDNEGFTETRSIQIDTVPPETSDNAPSGWVNYDVLVTLTPTDPEPKSGVADTLYCIDQDGTCTPDQSGVSVQVSSEGTNYVRYHSIDNADNIEAVNSVSVSIDLTPPTTTDDAPSGWQTTAPVTVDLTPYDPLSGVYDTLYCTDQTGTCTPTTSGISVSVSGEDTNYVRYYSTDNADNPEPIQSSSVMIDTANPSTSVNPSGTLGNNGWYTSDVGITLDPFDATSGIDSTLYCTDQTDTCTPDTTYAPFQFTAEGTNYVRYYSTDLAGNQEDIESAEVKIDKNPPTTSDNSATYSGWQTSHVTVTLDPNDPVSGISETLYCVDQAGTCTPNIQGTSPQTQFEGDNYVRYYSTDLAGHQEGIKTSSVITVDTIQPTLTAVSPLESQTYQTGDIDYSVSPSETLNWAKYQIDSGETQDLTYNSQSGNWESLAGSHPTLSEDSHTITFTGEDLAGLSAEPEVISFTIELPPNETTCNFCSDCSAKLSGEWAKVILTADIDEYDQGTCITFNADGVIFDGSGHKIDYDKPQLSGSDYGIDLNGKSGATIQNLEIRDFDFGIYDSGGSSNVVIKNNYIHHNKGSGVILTGSNNNVNNNLIEWNDLDGVTLIISNNNFVEYNVIQSNKRNGIQFANNDDSIIRNNDIFINGYALNKYGIELKSGSNGNQIYHNNFITNFNQAFDSGVNSWDDGVSEGNYWDDYGGSGPYYIPGGSNQDNYPSLNPW